MGDVFLWLVAIGVVVGMIFYGRTGISMGGVITPGVLAYSLGSPARIIGALAGAIVVWVSLELLSRVFALYGRQRIAAAMFMALVLRIALGSGVEPWYLWVGWAIPGLMAADFQRQGPVITVASSLSGALVSAMAFNLLLFLRGAIS